MTEAEKITRWNDRLQFLTTDWALMSDEQVEQYNDEVERHTREHFENRNNWYQPPFSGPNVFYFVPPPPVPYMAGIQMVRGDDTHQLYATCYPYHFESINRLITWLAKHPECDQERDLSDWLNRGVVELGLREG